MRPDHTTWRLVLDCWPKDGRIKPKLSPLQSVTAAPVYNEANAASEIDISRFIVDAVAGVIVAPGVARKCVHSSCE